MIDEFKYLLNAACVTVTITTQVNIYKYDESINKAVTYIHQEKDKPSKLFLRVFFFNDVLIGELGGKDRK